MIKLTNLTAQTVQAWPVCYLLHDCEEERLCGMLPSWNR